jgi:carbon-monoxide dehydrogenase medium subunit
MIPCAFDYEAPTSLEEALSLLSTRGHEAKLLAGGQSLLPLMKLRFARPRIVIDLGGISGLRGIRRDGDQIAIGALTSYSEIVESELLRSHCALLPQTAVTVGDVQVRNQGTLGGALAHADPAADMPAAIAALDANLKIVGPKGERIVKAHDFFVAILTTNLARDEILTEIRVPRLEQTRCTYVKAAKRASGFAIVGIAVRLRTSADRVCEEIAVGLTGITDRPHRAETVESMLRGKRLDRQLIEQAALEVTRGLDVTADINGSSEYRSHLTRVHMARALHAVSGDT